MKIVKGGIWSFEPTKAFGIFFDGLMDTMRIAAQRMEDEAKQLLAERMIGEKSSGELIEGIEGYVLLQPKSVIAGVGAEAYELGQWEEQQGESREAVRAEMAPPFDYAQAVEEGTGEFGPTGSPITPNSADELRFWTGRYTLGGKRVVVVAQAVSGQPGLWFLRDAWLMVQAQIDKMLRQVATKVAKEAFVEKVR